MNSTFMDVVGFLKNYADFNPEEVTMDSRMVEDLGVDSLSLIMMVDDAEQKFHIVIRDDQLMSLRTIGDVVRCVEEQN